MQTVTTWLNGFFAQTWAQYVAALCLLFVAFHLTRYVVREVAD